MPTQSLTLNANLSNIAAFNPNIQLDDATLKKIIAGQIVLVGRGSLIPVPPRQPGGVVSSKKGCIDWAFYGTSSSDLERISIDGTPYAPENLKDFAEIIKCAWMSGKCINFCIDRSVEPNRMFMLNVYPQCCCKCEEVRD